MNKAWGAALLLLVLCVAACKKENGPSRREQLVGKWSPTALSAAFVQGIDTLFAQEQTFTIPCETDNFWLFAENSVLTTDEGPEKCNPTDRQSTILGNWILTDGDTKLGILTGSDTVFADIQTLDAITLTLHFEDSSELNNQPARTFSTYTFAHR